MVDTIKKARIVGEFIKQKRESLRMSQRALGMMFEQPVSTQFISNLERGVTPLPPAHVPTLAKALMTSEQELMALLEKEYAIKLSGRLGKTSSEPGSVQAYNSMKPVLEVAATDLEFMRKVYEGYRCADGQARQAFAAACENLLKTSLSPKSNLPS